MWGIETKDPRGETHFGATWGHLNITFFFEFYTNPLPPPQDQVSYTDLKKLVLDENNRNRRLLQQKQKEMDENRRKNEHHQQQQKKREKKQSTTSNQVFVEYLYSAIS